MNPLLKQTVWLALVAAAPLALADAPKAAPAKPAAPHSTFVMPANPREGRDPFFPESTRPYEEAAPKNADQPAKALAVKGLSWEGGRPMVIINNHTFAIGDEGDVLTAGGRVHLRLVEIGKTAVFVEVNSVRRELPITHK